MMYCPVCGKQNADNVGFCGHCGARLTGQNASGFAPAGQIPAGQTPAGSYRTSAEPQGVQAPYGQQPGAYAPAGGNPMPPMIRQTAPRSKKPLFFAIGGVVLALLIGLGIWFLVRALKKPGAENGQPEQAAQGKTGVISLVDANTGVISQIRDFAKDGPFDTILTAAQKSEAQLKALLGRLPNLGAVLQNLDSLSAGSAWGLWGEMNFSDHGQLLGSASAGLTLDRSNKRLLAKMDLDSESGEFNGAVYLDSTTLQAASRQLLEGSEVLSIPLEELGKRWNQSELCSMLGYRLPNDLSLNLFSGFDLNQVFSNLETLYGENWKQFAASVKLTPRTEGARLTGPGTVYLLEWDSNLLQAMKRTAERKINALEKRDLEEYDELINFLVNDLNDTICHGIVYGLNWMDEEKMEIELLVDPNGCLTAVSAGHSWRSFWRGYELRLCGENNVWEKITMTRESVYDMSSDANESKYLPYHETYDVTLQVENGTLSLSISDTESQPLWDEQGRWVYDRNGVAVLDEDRTEELGSAVYEDSTGIIRVYDEDGDAMLEDGAQLTCKPENGGVTVAFVMQKESGEWRRELKLRLGPADPVSPLSSQPTDVLSMTEGELRALGNQLERNAEKLEDVFEFGVTYSKSEATASEAAQAPETMAPEETYASWGN